MLDYWAMVEYGMQNIMRNVTLQVRVTFCIKIPHCMLHTLPRDLYSALLGLLTQIHQIFVYISPGSTIISTSTTVTSGVAVIA